MASMEASLRALRCSRRGVSLEVWLAREEEELERREAAEG